MADNFTDDIERAIDDVGREMTACEPDGAFTARVLARIESGDTVRRNWRAAWIIAPLAAAAVIAIAVVMVSRSASDRKPDPSAGARDRSGAPTVRLADSAKATSVKKPDTTTENRAPNAANREPRTPNRDLRTTNPESRIPNPKSRIPNPDAARASEVAAMAPPTLSVPSIAVAPIGSDDSLQLPQLEPPPSLAVAPLEPGEIEKEIRR